MKEISKQFKVFAMTTRGYNASANGMSERVVRYVNKSLRALTDEAYQRWNEQVPAIQCAWNIAIRPDTGLSPFEINRGHECRMPGLDLATEISEKDLQVACLPSTAIAQRYTTALRKTIRVFHHIALQARNFRRAEIAKGLNKKGKPRAFKRNDPVLFYRPSTNPPEGRRARHCIQWFAGRVIRLLGNSAVLIKDRNNGRNFERHVSNVKLCTTNMDIPDYEDEEDIVVGTIVLWCAWPEKPKSATLAMVGEKTELTIELDLLATTGKSWKKATFKRAYVDEDGRLLLKAMANRKAPHKHQIWSASASYADVENAPCNNLALTSSGQLTAPALRKVEATGLRLHIF